MAGTALPLQEGQGDPNAVSLPIPVIEPVRPTGPIIAADRRLLLAVGRLVETKDFDRLIDAFAQIAADVPQWDLVILGDGREHDALQSRLASAGPTGRVLLPGRAGSVADWYARAGLYVMSSRFEGFPMTCRESNVQCVVTHGLRNRGDLE